MTHVREGRAVGPRRWGTIVLLLCSVVAGILMSEACHRVMRRFVCVGAPHAPIFQKDARFGWGHRPHAEGWWFACLDRRYEYHTYSKINGLGLRDREHAYDKPAGTRRVLLLGDSITEGMQVPLEQTFATLLDANLRARDPAIEVLNAGVAAFGTDNELLLFRAEGLRYAPDLVVLVFNLVNDVAENVPELHARVYSGTPERRLGKTYFHLDAAGALVADPPAVPIAPDVSMSTSWWRQIEDRLYVVRTLRRFLQRAPAPAGPATAAGAAPVVDLAVFEVAKTTPDPVWSEAWRVTEALIRALRTDVEQSGPRFAVAVMPSRDAVSDVAWKLTQYRFPELARIPHDPAYPVARLTAFLDREHIPYVNLLPPLRAAAERGPETGYFGFDVHLSATGHAIVAGSLTPFVADLLKVP